MLIKVNRCAWLTLVVFALVADVSADETDLDPLDQPEELEANHDEEYEGSIYGVIVDCGSSGTRAHLYSWDSKKSFPELLHDISPMRDPQGKPLSKKIVPGLSKLAVNPDRASDYIQPIIDFITQQIPITGLKHTGIYILATAGMRLLDEDTQQRIMKDIAWNLNLAYDFAKVTTSVISGADEGMYQWMSVNAKAKRFLEANTEDRSPTYGIMEMGGASIQITYQLKPGMDDILEEWLKNTPDALNAVTSQIVEPQLSRAEEEYNFRLVSVTFLGFGGTSAREAYVDLLIKRATRGWLNKMMDKYFRTHFATPSEAKTLKLKDPCLPKGSTEIMQKPVRMLSDDQQTIGYSIDERGEDVFTVKLKGSGDYERCKRLMKRFLEFAKLEKMNCKPDEYCSMSLIGTNFVPFHRFEFLGLSDFFYTTKMIGVDGQYDHSKVVRETKKYCSTNYETLLKKYPDANAKDETRISRECFKAVWLDTFLTEGINMPKMYKKFETVGKIRGDDLEWTLGAVLDKSLAIDVAASPDLEKWSRLPQDVIEKTNSDRMARISHIFKEYNVEDMRDWM